MESKAEKNKREVLEKTKEILLKKLDQLFVLFRYSNDVKIPSEWFNISIPDGMDLSNKTKFKIVNIMELNKGIFEEMLLKHNIKCELMRDRRNYYFYKIN